MQNAIKENINIKINTKWQNMVITIRFIIKKQKIKLIVKENQKK